MRKSQRMDIQPFHPAFLRSTVSAKYSDGVKRAQYMPAKSVKAKEQYRLVMECRSSGLTDHQWCREKGICPGTFYGWVRRLRQKGDQDIPEPVHSQRVSTEQEIVRIEPDIRQGRDVSPPLLETAYPAFPVQAMELDGRHLEQAAATGCSAILPRMPVPWFIP